MLVQGKSYMINRVHTLRFKLEEEREIFENLLSSQWKDYLENYADAKMYVISGSAKSIVVIWIFRDRKTALEVVDLGKSKILLYKNLFSNEHLTINRVLVSQLGNLTL